MSISFSARVSVPPDILVSELAGESVILSLRSERYFGLDLMGARMWTALTRSASVQAAYDELLAEFDVAGEQLRRDLIDLLEKLSEQGLIEIADG